MFNMMNEFENFAEEDERRRSATQARMRESMAIARYAHSRSGLLVRHLRRLADVIDPTGRLRSGR